MTDEKENTGTSSIDYDGKQDAINKAKAKAHDQDLERLRDEHTNE